MSYSPGDNTVTSDEVEQRIRELEDELEDREEDDSDFEGEREELKGLLAFKAEAEGYGSWGDIVFIHDRYFEDYARELAEDIHGSELASASWPFDCIDWQRAARELQADYSEIELQGHSYWYR